MDITWNSRQGRCRKTNSDAVAIAYSEQYLIVIIVDAAEKNIDRRLVGGRSHKGKRLAQYWADSCLADLISTAAYQDEGTLISLLHTKQKLLREHYLHDVAAYGALVINTHTTKFNWWFTGDCRLGLKPDGGEINWLGTPHRLENSPLIKVGNTSAIKTKANALAAKHILSQSLNARRFARPERLSSKIPAMQSIVIATDGYWCKHLLTATAIKNLEDDASLLTIKPGPQRLKLETDTPNLFVMYR